MLARPLLKPRPAQPQLAQTLKQQGLHPLIARLFAARGVRDIKEAQFRWANLHPPQNLYQNQKAAALLADAIESQQRILIVADYDCDGATACALGLRALNEMGADADFLVPDRFKTGYGLSPAIIELALAHPNGKPDIIVTVDNGIASIDGVLAAREAGIEVIITDHHLPGDALPAAAAIVNPNQPDCNFPSKNLAGVGVIFYLMLALRAELRNRGAFGVDDQPRLENLSDLLALGTVADVVPLDANNRILVAQGLNQIRQKNMTPGIAALYHVSGRDPERSHSFDLGFAIGPRINAAGRLADMSLGIQCLCTDDYDEALALAHELDTINKQRRNIEQDMHAQALKAVQMQSALNPTATVCVFEPQWHQGVVGLVAGRLKEKYWRPTIAFAQADDNELKGSGRSIPDVHLHDTLDLIYKRHPGLLQKFGGHAMAAGMSIHPQNFEAFKAAFEEAVIEFTGRTEFDPIIHTDHSLEIQYSSLETAQLLQQFVWGTGFAPPIFQDHFEVLEQRVLKDKHLRLIVARQGQRFEAIWFNQGQPVGPQIELAYRLDENHWNGRSRLQLIVEHGQEPGNAPS